MNSLSWKSPKTTVKDRQEYTPNIYRKPSVDCDEPEQKTQSEDSSPEVYKSKSQPLTYKSANVGSEELHNKFKVANKGHAEQDSLLKQMKLSYEQELAEYQEKQDALDTLKKEFSKKESDLNNKCSILRSTILKADEKIPEVEVAKLNEERVEFEKEKVSLEQDKAQLALDVSQYEEELESLLSRKSDIEEKTRLLEEQLSSGNELSLDLSDVEYSAALGIIKSSYYSEMKEINGKRADLESLKLETENEESSVQNRISALNEIREQAKKDFLELKPKIKKLGEMSSDYQSRLEEHERNEQELLEYISKHELEYSSLKEKHAEELNKLSHLKSECLREETSLKEKMEYITKNMEENKQKEDSIVQRSKQLDSKNKELEFELALISSKQKENQRMKENLDHANDELGHKREELDSLRDTLNDDINTHLTIRRQRLDIKKFNKKHEQQSAYIKSLEDNVKELQQLLEEARSNVKKNEIFTQILKTNLELSK